MGGVFKNRENKVRSGWKIAITITSYMLMMIIISTFASMIIGISVAVSSGGNMNPQELTVKITDILTNNPFVKIGTEVVDFICLMLILLIMLKLVEKKKFKDIGFDSLKLRSKDLLFGLLFGAGSIFIIFLILVLTGNATVDAMKTPNFTVSALWGMVLFILVGVKEELLSRGYCITVLNQMKKPWLSVIISSIIFSSLHLLNPNVKPLGLLNIVMVGVLFGYMYIKSGSLWMPIGYHITWNYFQGNVFGFPVSGMAQDSIFVLSSYKDNLLTGGAFGPEAGILTTTIIALGMYIIWKLPIRKNTRLDV